MPFVPRSTFEVAVVWTMRRAPSQAGQMRRRDFITAFGTAAAWPLAVRAQQPAKIKRIAMVHPAEKVGNLTINGRRSFRAFFEELSRLGYVEGQNLGVERYSGEGRPERYAELVRDVVSTHPYLIFDVGRSSIVRLQNGDDDDPDRDDIVRSDCPRTCGKHRAAGRQHHRRYYRWGIRNHWKTYGAAGRGDAKTVHRRFPCIATILGRCKRFGSARGGQTGRPFVEGCSAGQRLQRGRVPACLQVDGTRSSGGAHGI